MPEHPAVHPEHSHHMKYFRGDFSREDIYKMIDYVFPATITKTVTL